MEFEDLYAMYGDAAIEAAELIFGDSYEIRKSVDEAQRKKELLQTRISQASNVVGLGAGVAAIPGAYKEANKAYRRLRPISADLTHTRRARKIKTATKLLGQDGATRRKMYFGVKNTLEKPKVAMGLAAGGLGLQLANTGGDAITNVVLRRTADQQKVSKSAPIEKSIYCEISKVDTDKRQVFGWASVSKKDGQTVLDLQGDELDTEELERAAYDYMLKSRKGGHEHQKTEDGPLHVADVIESFVVTEEKKKKMGLPDSVPEGWWIGMKVNDDKVWELAKSGELAGFSIHGSGRRIPR